MASLVTPGGKQPLVKFSVDNGRGGRLQKKVYLPAAWSVSEQEAAKAHIEELAAALDDKRPESKRTREWLKALPDRIYSRLAAKGLCVDRDSIRIQQLVHFLEWVMEDSKIGEDGKPLAKSSLQVYRRTKFNLLRFFRANQRIDRITTSDAKNFRAFLLTQGNRVTGGPLKESTANKHCLKAREWFEKAKNHGWVDANPFRNLRGLRQARPRKPDEIPYVPIDVINELIDDAVDNEWKLLLGLWRFAGLRQLEPLELKVPFVSWSSERMTVYSVKNQRYEDKKERVIPIWPELRPYLMQQCEDAQDAGSQWLIFKRRYEYDRHKGTESRAPGSTITTRMKDQMLRLGIPSWSDLFNALRSSGETDRLNQKDQDGSLMFHPQDVAYWWNHSEAVQRKHYYTVAPSAYAKATATEKGDNRQVVNG